MCKEILSVVGGTFVTPRIPWGILENKMLNLVSISSFEMPHLAFYFFLPHDI